MSNAPMIQPVADMGLVFSIDTATGTVVADIDVNASNDMRVVSGLDRLKQDVTRWLLCPQGANPFDTSYGNPLWSLLGRPDTTRETIAAMVQQCEADMIQRQSLYAQEGLLSTDEQIQEFTDTTVYMQGDSYNGYLLPPGTVILTFNIVSQTGASTQVGVPLSSGGVS